MCLEGDATSRGIHERHDGACPGALIPFVSISAAFSILFNLVPSFLASVMAHRACPRTAGRMLALDAILFSCPFSGSYKHFRTDERIADAFFVEECLG